jgi:hypothetical protein
MLCTKHVTYLLAATFLVSAAVPAAAITITPNWKPRETVAQFPDAESAAGSDRMLAYDHHGNPGIAYRDSINGSLDYARRVPGVGWVAAEIDPIGTSPSLAFDRYERPAISYDTASGVQFAHFDGNAWQTHTADAAGGGGQTLAFDILGRAAIAYTSNSDINLKYVRDTDGDFSFADETPVTVDTLFASGFFQSLAFDPLNRPMIAHADAVNNELRFSVEEPGIGWITTVVDSNPLAPIGLTPSLAIDPDTGFPAIAYDGGTVGLRYAAWNGDSWDLTTVDPNTEAGTLVSLAFDPADGHPAISYNNATAGELNLAWHNGSTWQTQLVDSGGLDIFQSSLAFNDFGNGFPSIAYVNASQELYFIEDPPLAVPEPASALLMLVGFVSVFFRRRTTAVA